MIRLDHVSKSYGSRAVLRDISFHVDPGELVLLLGPSGAGKTTLLRLLHGAELPDQGDVLVADRRVALLRRSSIPYLRRVLGFVFQDARLIERFSAFENVAIALEVRGMRRKEIWPRVMQALTHVGLADRASTRAEHLSGGEQQRVSLARALVGEPSVILADEPTGNLDATQARVVMDLLRGCADRGVAVLLATHDALIAHAIQASRVLRLQEGRLTAASTLGLAEAGVA